MKYNEENYLTYTIEFLNELKDLRRELDKDETDIVDLIKYLEKTN